MDSALLEVVCCPVTRQPLSVADARALEKVNAQIAAGALHNAGGKKVTAPLEGALLREDGAMLYPVCGGIPVLLPEEGIAP